MSGSRSYLILALNDRARTIADWRARQGTDWVDQMLLGGMLKCAEHGYRLIVELVDTHSDHVTRELLAAIAALQPDGIILTPPHSDNPLIVRCLSEQKIPFARIGSKASDAGMPISMDDEGSAANATRYLARRGHRRIGFIAGAAEYNLSGWRVDGWKSAMAEANLPIDGLLQPGDFTYASGEHAARHLLSLKSRPSAIIASSDQMALATLEVARALKLRVPEDLSVISFDNTPLMQFTQPQLTAIDQPIAATASKAVELIIAAQKDEAMPEALTVIPATLVERGSVADCKQTVRA
jgi:LacI family transcriptional regulator